MQDGRWTIRDCDRETAQLLAAELGVGEITASVLVRRGHADPVAARAFLAAEMPGHDPLLLGDMAVAVERIRAAIDGRERICVHGD
jgi:single-stranded-DNA-specific exonuclease